MKPEHQLKLNRIREHLGVSVGITDPRFSEAVCTATRDVMSQMHGNSVSGLTGEDYIQKTADELHVKFEEVHSHEDIFRIEESYLRKKEFGLAQLELELNNPEVDALLFQRQKKKGHFVAVLNLQDGPARGYWSRSHEISHRLIEPPQQELMYRHRACPDPVEQLVDIVAAEIAFYEPLFAPLVASYSNQLLSWDVIERIQAEFCPTASRMAVTKSVLRYWSHPAFLIYAEPGTRKSHPTEYPELRVTTKDRNALAGESSVFFIPNMRVPKTSPVYHANESGCAEDGFELLSNWVTSGGDSLPKREASSSAIPYNGGVLALVSPL